MHSNSEVLHIIQIQHSFLTWLVTISIHESMKEGSVALTVTFSQGFFPSSSRDFQVSSLWRKSYTEDKGTFKF